LEEGLSGSESSRILVVDDEKSMLEFLDIMLTQEGYDVFPARNGQEACDAIHKEKFDLVITDIRMKGIDGIEVLRKAKSVDPGMTVVLISAFATAETAVEAMKEGAYDFIPKPFKVRDFKRLVREALQSRKQPARNEGDEPGNEIHFGCMMGESPQMKKVYELVRRVADTRTNVLVSGESGTGKELVAKAIHGLSERSGKPFVVINCAGLPETLIESELFGYKKGAFTGAQVDKVGLFETADGGTVFLDEVGELSPAIQVKLLRVIQERRFTALGDTREKGVDVRIISATNKDLENEVIEKRFREDLFFRLNVIHISMPPLRDREGDLPLLSDYFLRKFAGEMGKEIKKISSYAMNILSRYYFPGNVRELENIIERSVALETSNIVLPESLALSNFRRTPHELGSEGAWDAEGMKLEKLLEKVEKQCVLDALKRAEGSKQRASELLGITLRSLRYRLDKLGIHHED
jgi:two-component system, NtrC family, response regulator PilR